MSGGRAKDAAGFSPFASADPVVKGAARTPRAKPSSAPAAKTEGDAATPASTTPHYHGHRDRLRARFAEAGPDAFADYELLELYLFRSIPRQDVKPMAKALLARFGSFAEVLAQPVDALTEVKGVSERVALDLKIIQAAARRLAQDRVINRPVLASWSALITYLKTQMSDERIEEFRVLFLDRKNRLIADERLALGTVDQVSVHPREVIKRALAHEATALILAHNHPSGDPTPSRADIDMTKELVRTAQGLSITLHDHVIVGKNDIASFKSLGLL